MNPAFRGPRTLHDVISNSAVHDVHSARFLMPGEIVSVTASHIPFPDQGDDTCRYVLIELRFDDGALGIIQCSADAGYGYEVDVEITCESGVVHTSGLSSALVKRAGVAGYAVEDDWLKRFDEAYVTEAKDWVNAIITGESQGPSAWDGYVSMLVTDKCVESVLSASPQPVSLPSAAPLYR